MCLHDIDDMPHAVSEIARVLGRSGRLCAVIPHPISTAGSFQGRDAGAPFVISGSYMQTAPLRMVVDRGGIRLTFHSEHRPLASYTRALEASGLLIEAIREVRPPGHLAERDPLPGGGSAFRSSCTCERSSRDQTSGVTGRLDVLLAAAALAGWLKVR
jgi:hypothetical protein